MGCLFDGLALIVKCEFESGLFVPGSVARLTWSGRCLTHVAEVASDFSVKKCLIPRYSALFGNILRSGGHKGRNGRGGGVAMPEAE